VRPSGPSAPAPDREWALKLTKEGDQHLSQGNVAAARNVYELAAEAGLAQAAMALAGTYDAAELARLNVRGVEPNSREAQRWYERARQLGAADAEQRLRRLGAK
jgi:TPR repeat protein